MLSDHHPRKHAKSFKYAFEGIDYVFKTQANFRVHVLFAVAVCVFAYVLNFSVTDFVLLLLTIAFILALEMVNTIFEVLVDHLWQEEHPKAKIIKDVAAGVVLTGAFAALLIGFILFIPYLLELLI